MRHAHQAHETKAAVDHNLPDDHCDTDRQHHQPPIVKMNRTAAPPTSICTRTQLRGTGANWCKVMPTNDL